MIPPASSRAKVRSCGGFNGEDRRIRLNGDQAKANYDAAAKAVKEGRYDDARAVELLPSDRKVIEQQIEAHCAALAKTTETE